MRQQQNYTYKLLTIIFQLRSRIATAGRDLGNLQRHQGVDSQQINNIIIKSNIGDAAKMPSKNSFDRVCNHTSVAVESMISLIIYWAGIFSWASFGNSLGFNDKWQIYVNTDVAV
jgi:low-affinity ferrous iron transport protein